MVGGSTVGAIQEQVISAFLDAWGDGETERPDVETIAAGLAENVEWQLWMPDGPILHGRDAVVKDIERQLSFATHMKCGLLHMTSSDRIIITERLDQFRSGDITVKHSLCAVFELDDDNKIVAWREYFDVGDVERQLKKASAKVPPVAR
ncbi:MAG: limonene--epoxide hydrolase [Pseudonocardiales bacterium]|jgi:limonene-1,2-epoxide hydrolase|nr:limonene--epoxide hydrolase [Pseudonocardiales bacterium]